MLLRICLAVRGLYCVANLFPTAILMDDNPDNSPQKRKRPWIHVPMREQPLLVILMYLVPLAVALFLVVPFG